MTVLAEPSKAAAPSRGGFTDVHRKLLIVAGFGLFVRVAYVLLYARTLKLGWDASWYTGIGDRLASGHGYSVTCPLVASCAGRSTALFPPVMPLLYAATAKVGASSLLGRQLVLAVIGSVTVFLFGLLGLRVGGPKVAIAAAVLAAINPMMILLEGSLMSEAVAVPLAALMLILLVDQRRETRTWRWFALGGVAGVAALTRGEGVVWLVVVMAPCIIFLPRETWRRRLIGLATIGLTTLVVVSPWLMRNQAAFGTPYLSQPNLYGTMAATSCRAGFYGPHIGDWVCEGDASVGFTDLEGANLSEAQAYAAAKHRAFSYTSAHLGRLPIVVVAREARAWSLLGTFHFQTGSGQFRFSVTLFDWFLFVTAAAGTIVAFKRRIEVWPLLLLVLSVTATIAVTYGNPRYLATMTPTLAVLGGIAITQWLPRLLAPARPAAKPAPTPTATSSAATD